MQISHLKSNNIYIYCNVYLVLWCIYVNFKSIKNNLSLLIIKKVFPTMYAGDTCLVLMNVNKVMEFLGTVLDNWELT